MMAAHGVSTGIMTTGDFVMIQALFMQLAGPLFNMGTFFREIDQSSVDVEDLYHILKQNPNVVEKQDAKEFVYNSGGIKFENLGFKHFVLKDEKNKEIDEKLLFQNFNLELMPGTINAIVG